MKRALICGLGALAFWTVSVFSILAAHPLQGYLQISDELTVSAVAAALPAQESPVPYDEVAPILTRYCIVCHSGPTSSANLRLDSYSTLLQGGRSGSVVVPGNAEQSELIRRVWGLSRPRMPLNGPPWLEESEISLLERWISGGALSSPRSGSGRPSDTPSGPSAPRDSEKVTFTHVAPIFTARCVKCHAPKGMMGAPPEDIRLDSYQAIVSTTERAMVVPGFPKSSLLVRAIRGEENPRMPMDGPPYLDPAEIDLISMWVQQGARDPAGNPTPIPTGARIRLTGTLTGTWELDGIPILVGRKTHIRRNPVIGNSVEVRGHITHEGGIEAQEIRLR
jgi:mono/diheme cytochrome c family protein